jgi:hypothetical protein
VPHHDATTWKLPTGYEGPVGNANIEIEVRQSPRRIKTVGRDARKRRSELLGHLLISKGGIEWRPRSGKKLIKMRWEKFADLMEEQR